MSMVLLFLGGVWKRLLDGLSALLGLIVRYPWQAALVASLCLSAGLWRANVSKERQIVSMKAERAKILAASKAAAKAQAIVNHEPARKSGEIAENSNAQAPAYYDAVRRAADAHGLRTKADKISRPDLPRADSAEPSVHGPAAATDLVCRPSDDDTKIIDAAARAAKMHQEALDLIAAGVAVGTDAKPAH